VDQAKFAPGTDIGPSTETLGFQAGGDAGDYIVHDLGVPAAEAEIGAWEDYDMDWTPLTVSIAQRIVEDNLGWLEKTYEKVGN
jgi:hypothetical protein